MGVRKQASRTAAEHSRLGLTTAICVLLLFLGLSLKSPRQKCDLTKLLLHNRAEPQIKPLVDEDADGLEDDKAVPSIAVAVPSFQHLRRTRS